MSEWPVELRGITESVVATQGPDERWNLAALGLHAGEPVTARAWGNTRTRRNFRERSGGYVQFTRDPRDFVDAALSIREEDEPLLDSADAWARVEVDRVATGEDGGTGWAEWSLRPLETEVDQRVVPATNRGYCAVVEATVAASRLDVDAYDPAALAERLDRLERIAERCGGNRDREAFERIRDLVEW